MLEKSPNSATMGCVHFARFACVEVQRYSANHREKHGSLRTLRVRVSLEGVYSELYSYAPYTHYCREVHSTAVLRVLPD